MKKTILILLLTVSIIETNLMFSNNPGKVANATPLKNEQNIVTHKSSSMEV